MANKRSNSKNKQAAGEYVLPIRWGVQNQLETVYANQLIITHSGAEFYLIFGELVPPALAAGSAPEFVEIEPVVRIAVSREAMLEMASAINKNIDRFLAKVESQSAPPKGEDPHA